MIPEQARPLVEELLDRTTLPPAGSRLHCAVSGGPDSTALLVLATEAGCSVTAHHVDHGLRPGSADEADVVAGLADRFGASFHSHRVVVEPGPNLEARARKARYAVLPRDVVTGHTLDDRAETVLINLLRGAGRRGLSPHTDRTRHPLIDLRRRETVELCARIGLVTVTDPSNDDRRHLRNRVCAELLPLLQDVSNRDLAPVLARQADLLGEEDMLLDELAAGIDPTDARQLAAAPAPLARRAIRRWIIEAGSQDHPPAGGSVERVLEVARGSAVSTQIEGGQTVHRSAQRLRLEPPSVM